MTAMRRGAGLVLLLALFAAPALAAGKLTFPALTGRVVDDAHILRADTIQSLDAELASHEQATGNQIVVVTLPDLQGQAIEDYGYQLGRAWGIGRKGKDNGALLIVAPKEHKARIEVGYGLEGQLTDAACAAIVQNSMLPAFRRGDYDGGITAGTQTVLGILGGITADAEAVRHDTGPQDSAPSPLLAFFVIAIIFFSVAHFASRRRSGGLAPFVLGSLLGGGFGGGGFSGGGGSFGGGGASGSW